MPAMSEDGDFEAIGSGHDGAKLGINSARELGEDVLA